MTKRFSVQNRGNNAYTYYIADTPEEALEFAVETGAIRDTSRGRVKEMHLNRDGIPELLDAWDNALASGLKGRTVRQGGSVFIDDHECYFTAEGRFDW